MPLLTALLLALSEIESGNNDAAIGKAGERGRYQIMEATWREHFPNDPHSNAHKPDRAERAAKAILYWHEMNYLKATGRPASAKDIYAMWNLGFAGYQRLDFDFERLPVAVKDRCVRFENLAREFGKR